MRGIERQQAEYRVHDATTRRRSTECMTPPRAGDPAGPKDRVLKVFGETVIVKRSGLPA